MRGCAHLRDDKTFISGNGVALNPLINRMSRGTTFGQGAHACAGQSLARLETSAMLRAMVDRVDRVELTAQPTWTSTTSSVATNTCRSS